MLTVYFGLNLILNYSWLFGISMLKGSFDGKNPKFFMKKKHFMAPFYGWGSTALRLEPLQGGSLETNKVPKTTVPSSVCVLNQIGVLLRKPN